MAGSIEQKARNAVKVAVRQGKLTSPEKCEWCSAKVRLDGHHFDYEKHLDVTWLCRPCHRVAHQ